MSDSAIESPEMVRPPRQSIGAIGWLRAHLFSSWFNTILTGLAVWIIIETIPGIITWAFVDSVWGDASPETCKAAEGACWAFIYEKYRFILFGVYPWEEHYRPLLAMIIFLALVLTIIAEVFLVFWPAHKSMIRAFKELDQQHSEAQATLKRLSNFSEIAADLFWETDLRGKLIYAEGTFL